MQFGIAVPYSILYCKTVVPNPLRGLAADTLMDVDIKLMLVNYLGHVAVTKGCYFTHTSTEVNRY